MPTDFLVCIGGSGGDVDAFRRADDINRLVRRKPGLAGLALTAHLAAGRVQADAGLLIRLLRAGRFAVGKNLMPSLTLA